MQPNAMKMKRSGGYDKFFNHYCQGRFPFILRLLLCIYAGIVVF